MEQEIEQEVKQVMVVNVAAVVSNILSLCSNCLACQPLAVFPGQYHPSPQVGRWIGVLLLVLSSWR